MNHDVPRFKQAPRLCHPSWTGLGGGFDLLVFLYSQKGTGCLRGSINDITGDSLLPITVTIPQHEIIN